MNQTKYRKLLIFRAGVMTVSGRDHAGKFRFRFLVAILMVTNIFWLNAQDTPQRRGSRIIDDTTKQIYGPRTTKYYYENDVFYNRPVTYQVDTFSRNFHRYTFVQRNNNLYVDLGNIGTAMRPVFYQAPDVIGMRSGYDAYDVYWNSAQIRYYDTKSPHSNMNVILGGRGRSLTRANFSRNINPRWNFGFNFRGLFIDKQIQRGGKGDRITRSNYYDLYTAFHTRDSVYRIFANARRMFHRVEEFGGVRLADGSPVEGYFDPNARTWLTAAESNDLRINYHLYHQLQLGRALQLYHMADRYRQKNALIDMANIDGEFYDLMPNRYERDSIHDKAKFKVVRNEIGVKGNLLKLFYNGYYAIRHYKMYDYYLPADSMKIPDLANESYLGGRIELRLDSIGTINGWAEVNQDGNYRIEGNIVSKWFEASIRQMLYKPSFAQSAYEGTFNYWNESFANTESSQVNGYVHYRSPVLTISPGLTFTRLRNYIFFKKNDDPALPLTHPVQSSGNQIFISPELRFSLTLLKHITFSNQVILTRMIENADQAIRIPEQFVNSQLSYANIFFNGNLDMHAGVDLHWKSNYFALAYDPAIRQFYTQDNFEVEAFPVVDIFFNAKIKRGRIFLKFNNFIQAMTKQGYFTAPHYPGQRNVFDFGFDWSFYD